MKSIMASLYVLGPKNLTCDTSKEYLLFLTLDQFILLSNASDYM